MSGQQLWPPSLRVRRLALACCRLQPGGGPPRYAVRAVEVGSATFLQAARRSYR